MSSEWTVLRRHRHIIPVKSFTGINLLKEMHTFIIVTTLLNRDIKNSGLFKAVLDPSSRFSPSYIIEGTVDEFFEWDTQSEWKAILTVSIVLTEKNISDIKNRVLFQKTYKKAEICHQKKPRAVAEAMSLGLSKISKEMIEDVYNSLKDR
jgi:ABC-type uncharacterized transport system auxiliary subunit